VVPEYTDRYIIYDQSERATYPPGIDVKKVVRSKKTGHNISDNLRFIIDHYDNLPEMTVFAKGNIFPRHSTKEFFDLVVNNEYFTSIEDPAIHHPKWPVNFFSADGGYCEINKNWYISGPNRPIKYFFDYNDFLRYCFKDPIIPRYTRFAPGANYVLPKANILKYPKIFYENLWTFVSHCYFPGDSYIIERGLHTIWSCNFQINEKMLEPVDEEHFVAKESPKGVLTFLHKFMPYRVFQIRTLLLRIRSALD
jgi:hypothetical protein